MLSVRSAGNSTVATSQRSQCHAMSSSLHVLMSRERKSDGYEGPDAVNAAKERWTYEGRPGGSQGLSLPPKSRMCVATSTVMRWKVNVHVARQRCLRGHRRQQVQKVHKTGTRAICTSTKGPTSCRAVLTSLAHAVVLRPRRAQAVSPLSCKAWA